jgi:SAM-dependent methyltransferase
MRDDVKVNLGAGITHIPGFVNVDVSPRADVVVDLSRDRLPFESDSVDLVFSHHTLEHVANYLFALSEIHRVLKHGGRFLVGLPYVTLTKYHLVNPYHLHNFNEYSFDFFDPQQLLGSAAEQGKVAFRKVFHDFHYLGGFGLLPPPLRGWCRRHLLNVVRAIDFGLIALKLPYPSPPITAATRRQFRAEFRGCLQARIPYA